MHGANFWYHGRVSFLVAVLSTFVIRYAVSFMLTKQKKDFSTYLLMGMEHTAVIRLFLGENILIGLVAFLLGIGIGVGLSNVFTEIAMRLFETSYHYRICFSKEGLLCTFLLFLVTYGIGLIKAAGTIKHKKIIELLYDPVKNETYRAYRPVRYAIRLLAAAFAVVVGCILTGKGIALQSSYAPILIAVAILLFLWEIYKNSRIYTSGYDVTAAVDTKVADFDEVIAFIDERAPVKDSVSHYLYDAPALSAEQVENALSKNSEIRLGKTASQLSADKSRHGVWQTHSPDLRLFHSAGCT